MFDFGFAPDIEKILGLTYHPQTALASATMPTWVMKMIERHLDEPVRVTVQREEDDDSLEHGVLRVERGAKARTLAMLLRRLDGSAIVFGRTKEGVRNLNRELRRAGVGCVELQGDLPQHVRDRTMDSFREQRVKVLVATNVAARGLDITHVDLVVNFELPDSPEWLTHRIGRTARMGRRGWAMTMISPEDGMRWRRLRRQGAPDLPELDLAHLLEEGGWRYVDQTAEAAEPAAPRPADEPTSSVPPRRRRSRGRGRGRGRSDAGAEPVTAATA
jgi:superfamily II DNA/RNA helicase